MVTLQEIKNVNQDVEDELEETGKNSFKLATLDEFGVVNIWIVVELRDDTLDMAGSESDWGLSIGGQYKLVKSATIKLSNPNREIQDTDLRVFSLQFHPEDSNR